MSLLKEWQAIAETQRTPQADQMFWGDYFAKEKENYKIILGDFESKLSGSVASLAEKFDMKPQVFMGFLDGINTSLDNSLDLEELTAESEIELNINLEKLYFNMLNAKADWLYNLPEWDSLLNFDQRKNITREWRLSKQAVSEKKVNRNDSCPCGSGKKYKHCCMFK